MLVPVFLVTMIMTFSIAAVESQDKITKEDVTIKPTCVYDDAEVFEQKARLTRCFESKETFNGVTRLN